MDEVEASARELSVPTRAEAIEIATELKARYFFAIDNKLWPELRAVFSKDAVFSDFDFEGEGPDAFVASVRRLLTGARSAHQGMMPVVRVVSAERIRARWSMQDTLAWEPGSRAFRGHTSPQLSGLQGNGYYEEEYQRTRAGWKISYIRVSRLHIELLMGPLNAIADNLLAAPDHGWISTD